MSIEFETIADNCTPRNALFCCRSPVCLNNSPKLVPLVNNNNKMDGQQQNQSKVYPVCVPDLSDGRFYTNLMSTKLNDEADLNNFDPITSNPISMAVSQHNHHHHHQKQQQQQQQKLQSTPPKVQHINKSQSAVDIRHGISLRRVTPPKCTVTVKKSDAPLMNVVLKKVEKKLLEPPKPIKHEKSPPPKKLTSAATNAGIAITKPINKKTKSALNNQNSIAKSKSTNDVLKPIEINKISTAPAKPPPPVNLLKTQRPPLEIHRIEGDKIIIIRRVPRSRRVGDSNIKFKSLPSLTEATVNQVKISVAVNNKINHFHFHHYLFIYVINSCVVSCE